MLTCLINNMLTNPCCSSRSSTTNPMFLKTNVFLGLSELVWWHLNQEQMNHSEKMTTITTNERTRRRGLHLQHKPTEIAQDPGGRWRKKLQDSLESHAGIGLFSQIRKWWVSQHLQPARIWNNWGRISKIWGSQTQYHDTQQTDSKQYLCSLWTTRSLV